MDVEGIWVKRDDGNASSQPKDFISTNTEPELNKGEDHSKRDGADDSDDGTENESDIEVTIVFSVKDLTHFTIKWCNYNLG